MLSSGAHVEIAGYELLLDLDEEREDPYAHTIEPVTFRGQDSAPGLDNVRSEIKLWVRDDWSGGEGDKFHDPEHPDVYYRSKDTNPMLTGQLVARPMYEEETLP